MKMKKLNKKGFTLIELLAVIVILAVVMGIAANSVLNSMNKARGGSLLDSAQVIARGMDQRLMAVQVEGGTSIGGTSLSVGTSGASYISETVGKEYGLNATDYIFSDGTLNLSSTAHTTPVASFIYYNATNNSFVVCLMANSNGKNYVAGYVGAKTLVENAAKSSNGKTSYNINSASTAMFGCSNGNKTW